MNTGDKEKYLTKLDSAWVLSEDKDRLERRFSFSDFKGALELVNLISLYAEEINHHPEILFGWGYMKIKIWTHTHNDVLIQDFEFAGKVDELSLLEQLQGDPVP